MSIKARGQFIDVNDQVALTVQYRDQFGNPIDLDFFPQVSIVQPSGLRLLTPTSAGVSRNSVGQYQYVFTVPYNGPYGVFQDIWDGYVHGMFIEQTFDFVVAPSEMATAPNADGYVALGDDPGFHYSQCAIKNINKLIKSLKARLNSSGKAKSLDQFGNTVYQDCDIFTVETLTTFLATALSDFNQVPYFTFFQFDDDNFVQQFFEILVEGATLYSLASIALIQRGVESVVTDQGINFQPATVSELLQTQYSVLLTNYWEKLKMIKASLRPFPIGVGLFSMSSGSMNPALRRMRHLRQRQLV
jgi:hypothetical protein